MIDNDKLFEAFEKQAGVLKTSELRELGLSSRQISRLIETKVIASKYLQKLSKIDGIKVPSYKPNIEYNYSYFPILINHPTISRDEVFDYLKEKGINTKKYFYPLVTDYACYKGKYDDNLPVSRMISEQVLCLPLYGEMTNEEVSNVISSINQKF